MARPSTKSPLLFGLIAAGIWLSAIASHALAQDAPEITLRVNPAELKVIATAMAAKPNSQTLPLVVKLQAQINAQFPPGPLATELPLPAIAGASR
jgi:hypothetical protein